MATTTDSSVNDSDGGNAVAFTAVVITVTMFDVGLCLNTQVQCR